MIKKLFDLGRLKAERDTLLAALELIKSNASYQPSTRRTIILLSEAEWWMVCGAIRMVKPESEKESEAQ